MPVRNTRRSPGSTGMIHSFDMSGTERADHCSSQQSQKSRRA
jgi:hypothetical protein